MMIADPPTIGSPQHESTHVHDRDFITSWARAITSDIPTGLETSIRNHLRYSTPTERSPVAREFTLKVVELVNLRHLYRHGRNYKLRGETVSVRGSLALWLNAHSETRLSSQSMADKLSSTEVLSQVFKTLLTSEIPEDLIPHDEDESQSGSESEREEWECRRNGEVLSRLLCYLFAVFVEKRQEGFEAFAEAWDACLTVWLKRYEHLVNTLSPGSYFELIDCHPDHPPNHQRATIGQHSTRASPLASNSLKSFNL